MQPVDVSLPFNPLVLDSTILLGVNADGYTPVPTILSALAISQTDFDLLVSKTDNHLSVDSLSILFRYVYLARGLRLSIADLYLFLAITNTTDPFTDPQATYACLDNFKQIKSSGLSILQLDYVLNYSPESPAGLRDESLAQLIDGLRRILEDTQSQMNFLNLLIAFNADDLTPLNGDAFMLFFSPIQSALITATLDLSGIDVSADEIRLINEFSITKLVFADGNPNPTAAASKADLIANIKKVQNSATAFLTIVVAQKQNQIKSHVASSFSITTEQADVLLSNLIIAPATVSLLAQLENESLIAINAAGVYDEITRANFGDHFNIYTLLHKAALLVSKLKIETENLSYFIANYIPVKTINFSTLPVSAAVVTNQFTAWLSLHIFLSFKSKFPEPENVSIRSILDLAKDTTKTNLEIKTEISLLTKWDDGDVAVSNLTALETGLGIRHTVANLDYTVADTYLHLWKCFDEMKLTGADAAAMLNWRVIGNDTTIDMAVAQQTRQAIKSKYEQDDWLRKIRPIHDDLREKKRKAL